jgi:DNA-nicking Smr family endonuclease
MAKKPDPKGAHGAKPQLTKEDAALFDHAMRDVDKIAGKDDAPPTLPYVSSPARPPQPAADQRSAGRQPKTPMKAPIRSGSALPPLAAGSSADVDARTMDRLRRGRLRPEGRLDLHGLTQDKAHRALNRFIGKAQASGLRSIIIITGKGRVSEGGGVLRNQVPRWLNAPDIRPCVLAFAPAQPQDGGTGALYVLLRRKRNSPGKRPR